MKVLLALFPYTETESRPRHLPEGSGFLYTTTLREAYIAISEAHSIGKQFDAVFIRDNNHTDEIVYQAIRFDVTMIAILVSDSARLQGCQKAGQSTVGWFDKFTYYEGDGHWRFEDIIVALSKM